MSLNYDLTKIANYKERCFAGDEMVPMTKAIIFATISVKLGTITEKNAEEFYARLKFIEKVTGPFLIDGDGNDVAITPADVRAHIGLTVNVVNETRAKFLSGFKFELDQAVRQYRRAEAKRFAAAMEEQGDTVMVEALK